MATDNKRAPVRRAKPDSPPETSRPQEIDAFLAKARTMAPAAKGSEAAAG